MAPPSRRHPGSSPSPDRDYGPGHDAEPDGSECGAEPGRCGGEPTRGTARSRGPRPRLFRGENEVGAGARMSLYGGQVAAQALRAAGATVPEDRLPHSLHGYFLRPGRVDPPRDPPCRTATATVVPFRLGTCVRSRTGEVIFSMVAFVQRTRRERHVRRGSHPRRDPIPSRCRPGRHLSSSRCVRSRRPVSVTAGSSLRLAVGARIGAAPGRSADPRVRGSRTSPTSGRGSVRSTFPASPPAARASTTVCGSARF